MKYGILVLAIVVFGSGCMFVSGSYVPAETGSNYEVEGNCIGIGWDACLERAEVLCAEVGQKVSKQMRSGGPQNPNGIAIVPKRISIVCE